MNLLGKQTNDKIPMIRRQWLKKAGIFAGAGLLPGWTFGLRSLKEKAPKSILLHSSWQTVNIGDIAHTPGLLHLLEKHFPQTKIALLPKRKLNRKVVKMFEKYFPKVDLLPAVVNKAGKYDPQGLPEAFAVADLLLHGSGPSVVGTPTLKLWREQTDKPFGIYGVTIQHINDDLKDLLKEANFIFTRETHSLENLKEAGIDRPTTGFTPDATFSLHIVDAKKGRKRLSKYDLEEKEFICVIPRLRYTPYHKIRKIDWTEEKIQEVESTNARTKERDHAKLREAITHWVRETGKKVLLCPEMTYQLDIIDPLLFNPLPADVKKNVIRQKDFWLPDEAAFVYQKARAVISVECHSPIIAFAQGTPAFYVRQPEDTIKGQMWYDIGVDDWVFEIDDTEGSDIAQQLMRVHHNYEEAQEYLRQAMQLVNERHLKTIESVGRLK